MQFLLEVDAHHSQNGRTILHMKAARTNVQKKGEESSSLKRGRRRRRRKRANYRLKMTPNRVIAGRVFLPSKTRSPPINGHRTIPGSAVSAGLLRGKKGTLARTKKEFLLCPKYQEESPNFILHQEGRSARRCDPLLRDASTQVFTDARLLPDARHSLRRVRWYAKKGSLPSARRRRRRRLRWLRRRWRWRWRPQPVSSPLTILATCDPRCCCCCRRNCPRNEH